MPLLKVLENIYKSFPRLANTDFIIGKDSFSDLEITSTQDTNGFWYFSNRKKGLVTRFILQRAAMVEKVCCVTLIKNKIGEFEPRFDFQIWDNTKKSSVSFSKTEIDQNLIKAKVNFGSCHKEFLSLIEFIKVILQTKPSLPQYALVDIKQKDVLESIENFDKVAVLDAVLKKFGSQIEEKDIGLLLNRRNKLEYFNLLLKDPNFFEQERIKLEKKTGKEKTTENLWQNFFEQNPWIFGYGLQLIACEGLDDKKLEQTVVGKDLIDGSGKRIDALLKTKGVISKTLFCEIKTHLPDLLLEPYDSRPGVFVPAKDLRGAVSQIQKTIHKVTLKLQQKLEPTHPNGDPTGEEILFVKPRGVVVIGMLNDFMTANGINYEKISQFEIYRQQVNGIDIITYDELYERAKFIVESY